MNSLRMFTALAIAGGVTVPLAQTTPPRNVESLVAEAKIAAGLEWPGTFMRLCIPPPPAAAGGAPAATGGRAGGPPRDTWHAEPAKVADNLYFLGTKIHSAWALVGSDGIIVLEALFDYAAKDEILDGLRKVGLDPGKVKYVILSHAHGDHDGGAKLLQDAIPGVHLIYGAEDWDSIDKLENRPGGKPKRDMVGDDGMRISVGDASVRIVKMPGHTPGTLSYLFDVRDNGKPLRWLTSVGPQSRSMPMLPIMTDVLLHPIRWLRPLPITAQPSCCRITPNSTMPILKPILP